MTVPGIGQVSRVPRSLSVRTQRRFLRLSLHVHGVDSVICAAFRCGRSRCDSAFHRPFAVFQRLSMPFTAFHRCTAVAVAAYRNDPGRLPSDWAALELDAHLTDPAGEGAAFGVCFY